MIVGTIEVLTGVMGLIDVYPFHLDFDIDENNKQSSIQTRTLPTHIGIEKLSCCNIWSDIDMTYMSSVPGAS
jgi:hypothetical protein